MKAAAFIMFFFLASCSFAPRSFIDNESFYGIEVRSDRDDNESFIIQRKLWILLNQEEPKHFNSDQYKYLLKISLKKDFELSAIESDAFLANKTLKLKVKYSLYKKDDKRLVFSGEDMVDGSYSAISSTKLVSEYMTDKAISSELSTEIANLIYYSIRLAILSGDLKI